MAAQLPPLFLLLGLLAAMATAAPLLPLCSNFTHELGISVVPEYARAGQSARKFETLLRVERMKLESDLGELVDSLRRRPWSTLMCFKKHTAPHVVAVNNAWMDFFAAQGVQVTEVSDLLTREQNANLTLPCTLNFVWAVKRDKYLSLRSKYDFPHIFILEQPWFWRVDPVDNNRHWHFFGWDYLNGYAVRWEPLPNDRWTEHFSRHILVDPWIPPRPDGYALFLGQVPTDTAVVNARLQYGSVDAMHKHIVQSIRAQLPGFRIVFRPHPRVLSDPRIPCKALPIEGVEVWTDEDKSLEDAIRGASFVVTFSSNSAVEAIFRGIPVINLDPAGPAWPVSCHDFSDLPDVVQGTACRPIRDQFLANLGYTMWNLDQVRNGDAFRYYFNTDMPTQPVTKPWNETSHYYRKQFMSILSYTKIHASVTSEAPAAKGKNAEQQQLVHG